MGLARAERWYQGLFYIPTVWQVPGSAPRVGASQRSQLSGCGVRICVKGQEHQGQLFLNFRDPGSNNHMVADGRRCSCWAKSQHIPSVVLFGSFISRQEEKPRGAEGRGREGSHRSRGGRSQVKG